MPISMTNKDNQYRYHFKFHRNPAMKIFGYASYRRSIDILSLAFGIFDLDKQLKKTRVDIIQIERYVKNHKSELKDILSDLVSYVLLEKVEIEFFKSNRILNKNKFAFKMPTKPTITILFSGGIDSLAGIYWAIKQYSPENNIEGVFCAHSDQAWGIHIVNNLYNQVLLKNNINMRTIYVPAITQSGYAQLRGFLYMLSAGAWMEFLASNTLVISECGPTMYQPRFGPFDLVTMTMHPFVVNTANHVLKLLLEKEIKLITPFEDMTKAEVMAASSFKEEAKKTHSCISQRFGTHDGTCYGCVIRRLGAIAAGVEDVEYINNPISDETAQRENLLALLMFSQDILLNYENIPLYEIENIESYNKKDLFRRFALDNFAAIHLLIKKGTYIVKEAKRIYQDCASEISSKVLERRIEDIRNIKKYR